MALPRCGLPADLPGNDQAPGIIKGGFRGRVRDHVERADDVPIVPIAVLPEADYPISTHVGPDLALALLRSVTDGELLLEPVTIDDLRRAVALMERYRDASIGLVDASVVAVAERLGITRVLILDRRHFRMIRPRHCAAFELVP